VINVIVIVETFVAFVIAITFHECGHAAMANVLGDSTPASEGRLSLSPARHLAPIGTLVAGVLSFFPIYAGIGWGKPVRVDALRMRVGPNMGIILVALAGPVLNLVLGVALAIGVAQFPGFYRLSSTVRELGNPVTGRCPSFVGQQLERCLSDYQPAYLLRIEQFLLILALTNIAIAFINIIPLHPLDGYYVLFALLPNDQAVALRRFEPNMEAILLILFFAIPVLFRLIGWTLEPASIFRALASAVVTRIAGPGADIAVAPFPPL
jgi:Zn-dependent protease